MLVKTHAQPPHTCNFNNDEEFTEFCIESKAVKCTDPDTGLQYFDYPFTEDYLNSLDRGDTFHIDDPNSKIMKRGCITRGIITKWVDNLV